MPVAGCRLAKPALPGDTMPGWHGSAGQAGEVIAVAVDHPDVARGASGNGGALTHPAARAA